MEVEDASILALQQCNDILRLQEEVCNLLQEKVYKILLLLPLKH